MGEGDERSKNTTTRVKQVVGRQNRYVQETVESAWHGVTAMPSRRLAATGRESVDKPVEDRSSRVQRTEVVGHFRV